MKNGFPYPLTIDFITLGGIATACTIISCIKHFTVDRGVEPEPSWIFGPHFLYKVKRILPIGFLFGIELGVSGWGNAITPTSQHLLLSSTDLVWSAIFAFLINRERPPPLGLVAVCITIGGSVVAAVGAIKVDHSEYSAFDRVFGTILNLLGETADATEPPKSARNKRSGNLRTHRGCGRRPCTTAVATAASNSNARPLPAPPDHCLPLRCLHCCPRRC